MNRNLQVLERVRVASPCSASWEEMAGDDRRRLCAHCDRHVYNLSEMTRDEAMALIFQKEGRLCARFYRRADGTVLTRDCPVGVRRARERFARVAAIIAGVGALAVSLWVWALAPFRNNRPGEPEPSLARTETIANPTAASASATDANAMRDLLVMGYVGRASSDEDE
jgi:hypothetical protein